MNLSVIFHGDWEVYAHRDPVSGKRELLQEHIVRCEKYRIRISQERKLLKIEENFLTKLGLDKDDFAGKLVKEMIDAVILFHDLGKGTPAFQKNKMGNPNTIPTKYWGDDSSHSFLSAFLYLDFYLYEIKNGFNKVEKEQKKALIALAWELSYVIAKHHSNFESMEAYLKNFQLKAEELQRKWKEEPVPGFSQLRYFYEIPIAKNINQYFMCRKAFGRTENDIVHYFFIRLEYSILVACDYYATTEFNSGFEMDCFGKADASKFREIYERSHLMESIRKYGKESYPRKKWDGKEKINILRNELFLEAEENLKAAEEDSIYFVEAPTGSGKSNLALNLSLKFLEHADKVFEIYPFNTLAEQNRHTLETIFGKTEAINDIAVVNSLTPIRGRGNVEEDPEKYYKEALLDRQFLNYPFILSSHVTFFRTLFGTGKEDIMSFFQLLNSVVVLDEIQSYRNAIWTEIMIFLNSCAGLMNMKIIIMSATLPDLSQLVDGKCNVVKLIRNPEKYTLHPTFANRVICNYELLQEEITLDRLRRHVLENMQLREKSGAKILITFIKKQTAYVLYRFIERGIYMRVNGTLMNYYFHCKRQCYLHGNRLNLEDNSEEVQIGKALHEEKAQNENTEIQLENIRLDRLTKEYLTEIKKSDADTEASKWQLLYYLKKLKEKGIIRKGKLEFIEKNKESKKTLIVELGESEEEQLEKYIVEIEMLVQQKEVPPPINGKQCKKCAYYEYCYI